MRRETASASSRYWSDCGDVAQQPARLAEDLVAIRHKHLKAFLLAAPQPREGMLTGERIGAGQEVNLGQVEVGEALDAWVADRDPKLQIALQRFERPFVLAQLAVDVHEVVIGIGDAAHVADAFGGSELLVHIVERFGIAADLGVDAGQPVVDIGQRIRCAAGAVERFKDRQGAGQLAEARGGSRPGAC